MIWKIVAAVVATVWLLTQLLLLGIRLKTGVAVSRISPISLSAIRISYLFHHQLVEVQKIGIRLHRPTFARPTWISLVLVSTVITIHSSKTNGTSKVNGTEGKSNSSVDHIVDMMQSVRDNLRNIHSYLLYIKWIDVKLLNSSVYFPEKGTFDVGLIQIGVATQKPPRQSPDQKRVEWVIFCQNGLYQPKGHETEQIVDSVSININGRLDERGNVRKIKLAVKFGSLNIRIDEIADFLHDFQKTKAQIPSTPPQRKSRVASGDVKKILSTVLEGMQEIQIHAGYVAATKVVPSIQPSGSPLTLKIGIKDPSIDLSRLDPKSPTHRMYFPPETMAHRAFITAIAVSVGMDDNNVLHDTILNIPMVTVTARTTLLSTSVQISEPGKRDGTTNVIDGNIVLNEPSLDLEPSHLPLLMAMCKARSSHATSQSFSTDFQYWLPKVSLKLSIQEPSIRLLLRNIKQEQIAPMLISSFVGISVRIDSAYIQDGRNYQILTSVIMESHKSFYRSLKYQNHDLLHFQSLRFKASVGSVNDLERAIVDIQGQAESISIELCEQEIIAGLAETFSHLYQDKSITKLVSSHRSGKRTFLREFPQWLYHFKLDAVDSSLRIAGFDDIIGIDYRGVSNLISKWCVEYWATTLESDQKVSPWRKSSNGTNGEYDTLPPLLTPGLPSPLTSNRNCAPTSTDGRKLEVSAHGIECFVLESVTEVETEEPIALIPGVHFAMSTETDRQGPVLRIRGTIKEALFGYSLAKHYVILLAINVIKDSLGGYLHRTRARNESPSEAHDTAQWHQSDYFSSSNNSSTGNDFILYDLKVPNLRVKINLPSDPSLMLEVVRFDMEKLRWAHPIIKAKFIRVFISSPTIHHAWERLISFRHARVELKKTAQKPGAAKEPGSEGFFVNVVSEAIRIRIAHKLILHKISENIVNTSKTVKELQYRYKTRRNDYILTQHADKPKKLPKIRIRARNLSLDIEDDPFECRLSIIFRVGLTEARARLAREAAFELKVKNISNASGDPASPSDESKSGKSEQHDQHHNPTSMRYNPEEARNLSTESTVSVEEAHKKLQLHNSQAWIKRIQYMTGIQHDTIDKLRRKFMDDDEAVQTFVPERFVALPHRPSLFSTLVHDFDMTIDRPSFPEEDLPKFMYDRGKGLPLDTEYSIIVPMHLKLEFNEARASLRDYPLPVLHIPPLHPSQKANVSSFQLQTNLVIAEELRGPESHREVNVSIIPGAHDIKSTNTLVGLDVRRSVSPIKTYSDISIQLNSAWATLITWGSSLQPAIQDLMQRFESFTKPQVDESDKLGFWDKVRLIMHTRVTVKWAGDGDVHLTLKDPYVVIGDGSGLVMCWRGNVVWEIGHNDDQRKFTEVKSDEFLLAIPDFTHNSPHAFSNDQQSAKETLTYRRDAIFRKVLMKLSGNVLWQVGLMFQKSIDGDSKDRSGSFEFEPHYDVVLKNPRFINENERAHYDAFRGFRSQHLHLSISVISPSSESTSIKSYNTIHLTPKVFTHFFNWWHLFSGGLSLPVRHGKLFPSAEQSKKKFGRHLATIKYKLILSPLFLSHVYKHKEFENWENRTISYTGMKAKADNFVMDLHQRREHSVETRKGLKQRRKISHMKLHLGEIDFQSADIRALSATFQEQGTETLARSKNFSDQIAKGLTAGTFKVTDDDYTWIDMDDFVEMDTVLLLGENPNIKIFPLVYTPRFTYFRQKHASAKEQGYSAFGDEPSHFCVMSPVEEPIIAQIALTEKRAKKIETLIQENSKILRESSGTIDIADEELVGKLEKARYRDEVLNQKSSFLKTSISRLHESFHALSPGHKATAKTDEGQDQSEKSKNSDSDENFDIDMDTWAEEISSFNNRFIVHNMQAKWNNSLRNVILLYIHQVSRRRGFIYYMSRRAITVIIDMIKEHSGRAKVAEVTKLEQTERISGEGGDEHAEVDETTENMIQQLLEDAKEHFYVPDESGNKAADNESGQCPIDVFDVNLSEDASEDYTVLNSYLVKIIAPQIQLQSDKNKDVVALLAAQSMELKVLSIMDKDEVDDDISGLVQRRFAVHMKNAQFLTVMKNDFPTETIKMFSSNSYGAAANSFWPAWMPLENIYDCSSDPIIFKRITDRTSARMLYEKQNTLRLKYDKPAVASNLLQKNGSDGRLDHCSVEFKKLTAICNSEQYFSMLVIALDLLMYSEPMRKQQSERLEKLLLAADGSDLDGAAEVVSKYQGRIRDLNEIQVQFGLNAAALDQQGWKDFMRLEAEINRSEEQLFFIMEAITSSQHLVEETKSETNGVLRWFLAAREVTWQLRQTDESPLVELGLSNATYQRIDNSDGSNFNTLEIEMLTGFNLLPNAVYPELIGPYLADKTTVTDLFSSKILRVYWYKLESIGGIPVMDHFEVNLFPMKIQLEREVGKRLFEYVFPKTNTDDADSFSPFNITSLVNAKDNQGSESDDEKTFAEVEQGLRRQGNNPRELRRRMQPTIALLNRKEAAAPSRNKDPIKDSPSKVDIAKPSHEQLKNGKDSSANSETTSVHSKQSEHGVIQRRLFSQRNKKKHEEDQNAQDDDLNQMMKRANNYMTLVYVKVPSVILCLSYKGKGNRNVEDVHEFVFNLPTIEYRNKTWSHVDLVLHLKKEIMKSLISHAGALLENKLVRHRPSKTTNAPTNSLYSLVTSRQTSPNSSTSTNLVTQQASSAFLRQKTSFGAIRDYKPNLRRLSQAASVDNFEDSPVDDADNSILESTNGAEETDHNTHHNMFSNVLSKHLSHSSLASKYRETHKDDNEESLLKKSRLLLGKKLLGK